jgi:hypothetical protein
MFIPTHQYINDYIYMNDYTVNYHFKILIVVGQLFVCLKRKWWNIPDVF